jgi:hypothetical protein
MPAAAQAVHGRGEAGDVDFRTVAQSALRLTVLQHVLRIALEPKTRAELGGQFFSDYARSLRVPGQWADGDSVLTNYIGHPIQGAASGFIWLENDPSAVPSFALEQTYWRSRLRATAFAAGYSLQFELGPLSEASIGNVGLNPSTSGWVDHIVTPAGGLATIVAEDAVDRFVVGWIEQRVHSPTLRAVFRIALNPSRSAANLVSMRPPWHRQGRPLKNASSYRP